MHRLYDCGRTMDASHGAFVKALRAFFTLMGIAEQRRSVT